MNTSTKIAMAVAGGYVLGRRKKVKMALLLGSVLLGKRLDVRSLGREAIGRLANSQEFGQIRDEVRNELVSTSRAAAGAVVSAPLNKLSDNLHQRTAKLTGAPDSEDEEAASDGKAKQREQEQQEQERQEQGPQEQERPEQKPDEGTEPESRGEEPGEPEGEREDEERPSRTPRPRRPSERMSRTRVRRTPTGAGSRGSRE
ncbi:MAG: hypothetical protein ACRDP8_11445 [Actinopolymorphaceae bacterium]